MGQSKKIIYVIYVPDRCNTQKMCVEEVQKDSWPLEYVPEKFITQEMFDNAIWTTLL